jgi:hypothetical protein
MRVSTRGSTRRAWCLVPLLLPALAAADTTPLSALPARPARYAQAAGAVHVELVTGADVHDVSGPEAVCLISDPPAYWIDGDGTLDYRYRDAQVGFETPFGIERLVTRKDGAELERIAASVVDGKVVPSARSRIPLHVAARLEGLAVYAYRWDHKVFLLTWSLDGAVLRRDGAAGLEDAPTCRVVTTMMRVRDGSSEPVQIRGRVPATGAPYLVDASVSQTARDPAPLLSVTARLLAR